MSNTQKRAVVKKRKTANKTVSHGIGSFIRMKRINPSIRGYKKLQEHILEMENQLIREQCEPEQLTAKEEMLIKGTVEAYAIILLGNMFVKKWGVLSPSKAKQGELEYQAILGKSMIAYQNTIRQNIMALESLKRDNEKKPPMSEAEFVQQIEESGDEKVPDDSKAKAGA